MKRASGFPLKPTPELPEKHSLGHRAGYPSAKKLLIQAYWRKNKVNNLILLCAVSMIIFISFSIFSLIPAKINADIANHIYADGMCADAYVENGSEDLAEHIGQISFVKASGGEKQVGRMMKEDTVLGECIVYDEQTFQTMIAPALLHLTGDYPQNEEEILLSVQMLEQLGIDSPQIGMPIVLQMDWGTQEFVLSGYYEETEDIAGGTARAFLSVGILSRAGMEMYPCRILMQTDGSFLNGEQIAGLLSNELWMWMSPEQYIVANDSAAYQAIRSTIGGYRIGLFCCLLLFLFLFFILYNLKAVSLESDIRSFAMLKTIGVSNKEIRQIFWSQTWILWFVGAAIGSGLGGIAVVYILSFVSGPEPEQLFVRMCVLWLAAGVMMAAASGMTLWKMERLSLREAVDYTSYKAPKRANLHDFIQKRNRRNVLGELARTGAFRSRKKCIAMICFLFLGWEMVLCAGVLSEGLDRSKELEQKPDFSIAVTQNARRILSEEQITKWLEEAEKYGTENGQVVSIQDFQVNFDVEKTEEPSVKENLKNWVQKEHAAFHSEGYAFELPLYEITCKSNEIAENEESMAGNRILFFAICVLLVFAGVINNIGTTVTNLVSRKQEFILLGQIGMTQKQIRYMLVLESLIYFGISAALVLTVGNWLLFLLQGYMRTQMGSFTFVYPVKEWAVMFLLLGALSILAPLLLYRNEKKV